MDALFWQRDACELAQCLRRKAIDPVELLHAYRQRIAWLNPRLNAIISHNEEAARDAKASAMRHARGEPLSAIDGLPVAIKDNLAVRALPATFGSRLFAHHIPQVDEIPMELLRNAGAVIVGKTNVPEFCVEGYTDNRLFGLTRNPWNTALTPGGSSGGSVAAVASGMVPMAIGTDGGGSIRRPAAYTNLVGLKPSIGRIPRGGGLPQLLLDMEVVGPLTRSVRDQALLFDILARRDHRDHRSLAFADGSATPALLQPDRPLTILVVERFGRAPLDPSIAHSFAHMVDTVSRLGHHVRPGPLPLRIDAINAHWPAIGAIGLGLLLQRHPRMRELAGSKYVQWAEQEHSAAALLEIVETIAELRDQASQLFSRIDIVMTPTCAAMPWSTEEPFPARIDGQPVGPRGSAIYTSWVNACGHPAISLPGAMSATGLPIGIQFVAGMGRDELLLQLAAQVERAQGWMDQWPGIAQENPL